MCLSYFKDLFVCSFDSTCLLLNGNGETNAPFSFFPLNFELGLSYQPLSPEIFIWQLHSDPPSIPIFAQNVTFCMAVDVIPHAFL